MEKTTKDFIWSTLFIITGILTGIFLSIRVYLEIKWRNLQTKAEIWQFFKEGAPLTLPLFRLTNKPRYAACEMRCATRPESLYFENPGFLGSTTRLTQSEHCTVI